MRIRTTKPEFWRSPDTAALSLNTRLLFIGLWNYVDDNGVGEDDIAMIRSDLFPRDDPAETDKMIRRGLDELSARGLLTRYATPANGRKYLFVTNWHHQRIDKPTRSKKPLPTSENAVLANDSRNIPGILAEDSRLYQGNKGPREGDQGTEGPGGAGGPSSGTTELALIADPDLPDVATPSVSPSKRGTRIPDGYMPSPQTIAAIKQEFPSATTAAIEAQHRAFCDWARSSSSRNAVKKDWDATWRNWMRRELPKAPGVQRQGADKKADEWDALVDDMKRKYQS